MLRGYRLFFAALGLVLAAHHPNLEAQPKQAAAQDRSANALENIAAAYDKQAERAERSQESNPCKPGDDKRDSDLCAQWKAADAAADSAWWAAVGSFASAISTVLVLLALYLAFRSNSIARDTAHRQIRAYLSVENLEVRTTSTEIEIKPFIRNSGESPARDVICKIDMQFQLSGGWDPSLKEFAVFEDRQGDRTEGFGVIPKGGGVSPSGFLAWMVSNPQPISGGIPAIYKDGQGVYLMVYARGTINWRDVFNKEHEIHFSAYVSSWAVDASNARWPVLNGSGILRHNDTGFTAKDGGEDSQNGTANDDSRKRGQ